MMQQVFRGQSLNASQNVPPAATAYQNNVVAPMLTSSVLYSLEASVVNLASTGTIKSASIENSGDTLNWGNLVNGGNVSAMNVSAAQSVSAPGMAAQVVTCVSSFSASIDNSGDLRNLSGNVYAGNLTAAGSVQAGFLSSMNAATGGLTVNSISAPGTFAVQIQSDVQLLGGCSLSTGGSLAADSVAVAGALTVQTVAAPGDSRAVVFYSDIDAGLRAVTAGQLATPNGAFCASGATTSFAMNVDMSQVASIKFPANFSLNRPILFALAPALSYVDAFNPALIAFSAAAPRALLPPAAAAANSVLYAWNQVDLPPPAAAAAPYALQLPPPQLALAGKTLNFTRKNSNAALPAVTPATVRQVVLSVTNTSSADPLAAVSLGAFWNKVGFICTPDPADPDALYGTPAAHYIWDTYFYQ